MQSKLHPDTGLDTYHSLDAIQPMNMLFVSKWVVLTLKNGPDKAECCHGKDCNPVLLNKLLPCDANDPCLHIYNSDFLSLKIHHRPTAEAEQNPHNVSRPSSALSHASDSSSTSTSLKRGCGTMMEEKSRLAELLVESREKLCSTGYGRHVVQEMLLPDTHIKKLMEKSYLFLRAENCTRSAILQVFDWNLVRDKHFSSLIDVLNLWSKEVQQPPDTPSKSRQNTKKARLTGPILSPKQCGNLSAHPLLSTKPTSNNSTTLSSSRHAQRYTPYPSPSQQSTAHGSHMSACIMSQWRCY